MNKLRIVSLAIVSGALALAQTANPIPFYPQAQSGPGIVNVYIATAQTATISAVNLQCPAPQGASIATTPTAGIQTYPVTNPPAGAQCPAGVYEVDVFMQNTSGTNGGGTVTNTLGFHTSATAQTANVAGTLTESTGNFEEGVYTFVSDGTANITFATSQSSTGTYDAYVVLKRVH